MPPSTLPLPANPPSVCPNCDEPLADRSPRPPARYCPACGQETQVQAPTLREFAQQFGGAYFSTEGALWRTLRLLLLKPGELTRLYLLGRRKHYVLPLRLYLSISVLVLLGMRLTGASLVVIDPGKPVDLHASSNNLEIHVASGSFGMRKGVFYCEDLPQWLCSRAKRRIDLDPKEIADAVSGFKERLLSNAGAAMFLLLPSFALWLKLVYWGRHMRYTEHLVFALHVHAFWFLALILTVPNVWWLTAPACTAVPWYTMLAMRRVYGGRRWLRFLRAMVVSLLYLIVLTVAFTGVALWSLLA